MTAEEFRSEMIVRVRAFDKWAFRDEMDNPAEYAGYTFEQWFTLFQDFQSD